MPGRGRGAIEVEIVGLTNALKLPAKLEAKRLLLQKDVADDLAGEVRSRIRSRSGRLAGSWRGRVRRDGQAVVESTGVPYGRASVRGAFIQRRNRKALRGHEGRFAKFTRVNPGAYVGEPRNRRLSYVDLAFQQFGRVVDKAFQRRFGRIGIEDMVL